MENGLQWACDNGASSACGEAWRRVTCPLTNRPDTLTGNAAHEGEDRMRFGDVQQLLPRIGPIMTMPSDLWCHLVTYLWTSDAMSLRSTAHAVAGHLKDVTDAIQEGCRLIQPSIGEDGRLSPKYLPEVVNDLGAIRVDVRCEMLKRYAKQAGLYCEGESGKYDRYNAEPFGSLWSRYYTSQALCPENEETLSTRSWRQAVATTKAALLDVTFAAGGSVALCNLYAAQMYAPLLGVVAQPNAESKQLMRDAKSLLSTERWLDLLHATDRLQECCKSVTDAYMHIAETFCEAHAMPRNAVLANIFDASIKWQGFERVREVCLKAGGIGPRQFAEKIVPRITQAIVQSILRSSMVSGLDIRVHLRVVADLWGDDASFGACLHRAFLTALAEKMYAAATPWSALSGETRVALQSRVLGIPPAEIGLYSLEGRTAVDFWGAYFEVVDTKSAWLCAEGEAAVNKLPWMLKAVLWRLAAYVHVDPQSALFGGDVPPFLVVTAKHVDALCIAALQTDSPQCAIPALMAAFRWQVLLACDRDWAVSSGAESRTGGAALLTECPVFSPNARQLIARCSIAQRLPLMAALSSYRDIVQRCGYDWKHEAMVSADIASFLRNSTSRLIRPTKEIAEALWHYFALCADKLQEEIVGAEAYQSAFAERFDLRSAAEPFSLGWDRGS